MKRLAALMMVAVFAACVPAAIAAPAASGKAKDTKATKWTVAVKAKPLSENVKKGLAWLAKTQLKEGGWGQGEESAAMGNAMAQIKDVPNVADSCIATMAFLRAGNTPSKGQYANSVLRAVKFVCGHIEDSDEKSLYVTDLRSTRTQMKLGTYIDTFMSAQLLAQVKDEMPDPQSKERVSAALKKVLTKMEKNQREDGTWDSQGWAPVLSQSMATKAINSAAQYGFSVDGKVREKAETYSRKQYDGKMGGFSSAGTPGVALYSSAGNLAAIQASDLTNRQEEAKVKAQLKNAKTDKDRKLAQATLDRFEANRRDLDAGQKSVVDKLDNKEFVSGFGSNGGEEFLSYMNIGESLVVKGGQDWEKWDKEITGNLNRIQNDDGTWSGHHCITGRTFCTSAAIMVLTTDRAQVPVSEDIKKK